MRVSSLARALGSALPVLLVSGAVAWTAPPASASTFVSPVCADQATVLGYFAEVSFFNGLENCEGLCKKAYGKCKEFISKSKSCEKATVNMDQYFLKEVECDPIPDSSERKDCREIVNEDAKAAKQGVDSETSASKDECLQIRDDCIADCSAAPSE